jgi:hypothetical protein
LFAESKPAKTTEVNDSSTSKCIKKEDFLSNSTLLKKAVEELKFCEDKSLSASDLINRCLAELEQQGFLNTLEGEANEFLY